MANHCRMRNASRRFAAAPDASRRRRRLVGVIIVAGLSSLLIGIGLLIYLREAGGADPISVMSMFAGLLGVTVAAWQLVVAMPPPPADSLNAVQQLDHAAARLAEYLVAQWEREVNLRSLRTPFSAAGALVCH